MRLISFITSSHSLHMSQPNFTLSSYICTVEQQPILWKEDGDLSVSGFGGYLDIWNSCCIPKLGPHVCNTASQHFMAERSMISCLGQKNWTHIFFLKNCCTQTYFWILHLFDSRAGERGKKRKSPRNLPTFTRAIEREKNVVKFPCNKVMFCL